MSEIVRMRLRPTPGQEGRLADMLGACNRARNAAGAAMSAGGEPPTFDDLRSDPRMAEPPHPIASADPTAVRSAIASAVPGEAPRGGVGRRSYRTTSGMNAIDTVKSELRISKVGKVRYEGAAPRPAPGKVESVEVSYDGATWRAAVEIEPARDGGPKPGEAKRREGRKASVARRGSQR